MGLATTTSATTLVVPTDIEVDRVSIKTSTNGFRHVSSESLQLVMGFLTMTDRASLLATHRSLAHEPLATDVTSFCGRCNHCATSNEHLCDAPTREVRSANFWTTVMRRANNANCPLTRVRLAGLHAFTATTLQSVDAHTRTTALARLQVLELRKCTTPCHEELALVATTCVNSLRELRLRDMAINSQVFAALVTANKTTLQVIDLEGCHTLTDADVRGLAVCGAQLKSLSLAGCHNISNAAIADIVRACPQLESLNLRFCHKIDDLVVEKIAVSLPQLQELNLRYCMKVTDAAVRVICERLPTLATLDLSQCSKITDAAVGHIVAHLKSLKFLRLWACGKLTMAAVQAISEASSTLELIDIRSRDRLEPVIGGRDGLQLLARKRSRRWEPADQPGVFKRLPTCAVAA